AGNARGLLLGRVPGVTRVRDVSRVDGPARSIDARADPHRRRAVAGRPRRRQPEPPRSCDRARARAHRITFELMTGTGASHGLMFERTDDFLRTVLTFLDQHPIAAP